MSFSRDPTYDEKIYSLSRIIEKEVDKMTDLEESMVNAIDVFGLIEEATPAQIRVRFCVIALEGLLLKGRPKNLGHKLAERVALLVGDFSDWMKRYVQSMPQSDNLQESGKQGPSTDILARIALSRKMTKLYDKRSGFAHRGYDKERAITLELFARMTDIPMICMLVGL